MAVLYTFLVVMAAGLVSSKPTTDIVTEILRVIDGKEDLGAVADYLNRSRAEIVKELPLVDSGRLFIDFIVVLVLIFLFH